jgi:histone H4
MKPNETLSDVLQQMKQKGAQLRRAVAHLPANVLDTPFAQIPLAFNKVVVSLTPLAKEIVGYFSPSYWNYFLQHAKPGLLTTDTDFEIPNEPRAIRTPPMSDPNGPHASAIYRDVADQSIYSTPLAFSQRTPASVIRRIPTGPTRHGSMAGIIRKRNKPGTKATPTHGSVAGVSKRRLFTTPETAISATFQPINPPRATVRHRRVLKRNLLTSGDVRRLARRGGVKRISKDIKFETNKTLKEFLTSVVKRAVVFCDYAQRKTVTFQDVTMSLKSLGQTLYL